MISRLFFLIILIVLSFGELFAQTAPVEPPKTVDSGLINGKATLLPKPAYPRAAHAAQASGVVSVQVLIDEEGSVISADALSGHPLLRSAAVEAALQAKFSPTLLQGKPVKVSGIIIYNFVAGSAPWVKTGFMLANLEKTKTLINFDQGLIRTVFQRDWENELKILNRLEEIRQNEMAKADIETKTAATTPIVKEPALSQSPNSEQIALAQSLILSVQGRLASDPIAGWKFKLGIDVSRVTSLLNNPTELQTAVKTLREQAAAAPAGISPEYLKTVQSFLSVTENPKLAGKTFANLQTSPSLQEILEN